MAYSNYTAQTWVDGSASTPLSAARLNTMETGLVNAHFQPAVRVYHNTTQSHATSGSYQAVAFNSERFDQAGNASDTQHDVAVNNTRLTCRYAGIYLITGNIEFASSATGLRHLRIRHQGTTTIGEAPIVVAANDNNGKCMVTTVYALAVNEYVELMAYQSSTGALDILSTANYSPEFMMVRIG